MSDTVKKYFEMVEDGHVFEPLEKGKSFLQGQFLKSAERMSLLIVEKCCDWAHMQMVFSMATDYFKKSVVLGSVQ